jgi:hypothetical protein
LSQGGTEIVSADVEQPVVSLILERNEPTQRVCRIAAARLDLLDELCGLTMILSTRASTDSRQHAASDAAMPASTANAAAALLYSMSSPSPAASSATSRNLRA